MLTSLSGTDNHLSTADIDKLKLGLRRGATYYDSSAKAGTDNELLLWVELKEGSKLVLPSFAELIKVLDNDKREIDLGGIQKLLSQDHVKSEIEKVEIFYNKSLSKVINKPEGAVELDL
jgi:CRISPR-associated protein Csh2